MAIRWIQDGEAHEAEVYNRPIRDLRMEFLEGGVPASRRINTGNGLTGGGPLTNDLTITGVPASTTTEGMVRFATQQEFNEKKYGVAVSPANLMAMLSPSGQVYQPSQDLFVMYGNSQVTTGTTGGNATVNFPRAIPAGKNAHIFATIQRASPFVGALACMAKQISSTQFQLVLDDTINSPITTYVGVHDVAWVVYVY